MSKNRGGNIYPKKSPRRYLTSGDIFVKVSALMVGVGGVCIDCGGEETRGREGGREGTSPGLPEASRQVDTACWPLFLGEYSTHHFLGKSSEGGAFVERRMRFISCFHFKQVESA